jgi:hypothetical protein
MNPAPGATDDYNGIDKILEMGGPMTATTAYKRGDRLHHVEHRRTLGPGSDQIDFSDSGLIARYEFKNRLRST